MSLFENVLKNLDGTEYQEAGNPVSLKQVAIHCLLNAPLSNSVPDEKNVRFNLSEKLQASDGLTEFLLEELVLVKKLVLEHMPVLIAGQVSKLLDAVVNK